MLERSSGDSVRRFQSSVSVNSFVRMDFTDNDIGQQSSAWTWGTGVFF